MKSITDSVFAVSPDVRYVALYQNGVLESQVREGLSGASDSDSDKYEELLVNPTLLTLLKQRGGIDCGGFEYVLVRYGNFFQLVVPIEGGHVSVALEPSVDLSDVVPKVLNVLQK